MPKAPRAFELPDRSRVNFDENKEHIKMTSRGFGGRKTESQVKI
jgi:hypothetical protein